MMCLTYVEWSRCVNGFRLSPRENQNSVTGDKSDNPYWTYIVVFHQMPFKVDRMRRQSKEFTESAMTLNFQARENREWEFLFLAGASIRHHS